MAKIQQEIKGKAMGIRLVGKGRQGPGEIGEHSRSHVLLQEGGREAYSTLKRRQDVRMNEDKCWERRTVVVRHI